MQIIISLFLHHMNVTDVILARGKGQALSPDELLSMFQLYVDNSISKGMWFKNELVKDNKFGNHQIVAVPTVVPLTTRGFCLFCGLSHSTFKNYLNPQSSTYDMYHTVAECIRDYCAVQMFNGASVGAFNGNFVMPVIRKDFGLDNEEEENATREIKHSIEFSDFSNVIDTEDKHALPERDNSLSIPIEVLNSRYNNMPNYSSRHDDIRAYKERNGNDE